MILTKSINPELVELKADLKRNTIEGYASTFGNVDHQEDRVLKGAFKKTLKEKKNIRVLFQHDWMQPIGKQSAGKEDDTGLFVEGKVSDTEQGRETLTLINDGVIDSLSIGYRPKKFDFVEEEGVMIRQLKEINLEEWSPVVFPANESAVITGLKNIMKRNPGFDFGRPGDRVKLEDEDRKAVQDLIGYLASLVEPTKDTRESEPTKATPDTEPTKLFEEVAGLTKFYKQFTEELLCLK